MFAGPKVMSAPGFALLEVLIASALIATIAAGATALISTALKANRQSRVRTMATMLAAKKMEQLRSLTWTHMATSGPAISLSISDLTTDLSHDPATDDGPCSIHMLRGRREDLDEQPARMVGMARCDRDRVVA